MGFKKFLFLAIISSFAFASDATEKKEEAKEVYPKFNTQLGFYTSLNDLSYRKIRHDAELYLGLSVNKTHDFWLVPIFSFDTNFTSSHNLSAKMPLLLFVWTFSKYKNDDKKFSSSWSFVSTYNTSKTEIANYYLSYSFNKEFEKVTLSGQNRFIIDSLNYDQSKIGHTLFLWYTLSKQLNDKWSLYTDMIYRLNSPNHKTILEKGRKYNQSISNSVGIARSITDEFAMGFNVGKNWYSNRIIKGGNDLKNLNYTLEFYYTPIFSF